MLSNLKKSSLLGGVVLAASGLLCSPAFAADVTLHCDMQADDTAAIAGALVTAGAGGSVRIHGDCTTTLAINVSLGNQTIYGPGSVTQTAVLPAFRLFQGASGVTFEDLTIVSPNITIQNFGLGGFIQQPDNVTVRNCRITGLRAVQQFSNNIGVVTPDYAADTNRVTGASGFIANNWSIVNNDIDCIGAGPAIFVTGNDNLIEGNRITARNPNPLLLPTMTSAITVQNNYLIGTANGSLPGAARNVIRHNVISYASNAAATVRGISNNGYFGTYPAAPNAFGRENLVEKNCVAVDARTGFIAIGIQPQQIDESEYSKNNVTLPLNTPDTSNRGINTIDTRGNLYIDNDTAGGGDVATGAFTLFATSEGNLFRGNKFSDSSADIIQPQYVHYDDGRVAANPNAYVLNKWCRGVVALTGLSTAVGGLNMDGHFCSHPAPELPQAHDCDSGNGFAGAKSLVAGEAVEPILADRGADPMLAEFVGAEVDDTAVLSTRPASREIGRRSR